MTIHRTTVIIEVLHEGPVYDPSGPHQVAWDIDQGDHIGSFRVDGTEEIPAERVEAELVAIGNDGSFFGDEYLDLADAEPITPAPASTPDPTLDMAVIWSKRAPLLLLLRENDRTRAIIVPDKALAAELLAVAR